MRTIKYLLAIGLIGTLVGCVGDIVVKMPKTTDAGQTKLLADVKVVDLRQPGVAASKQEGAPMRTIEFDPPAAQLIKQELETALTKLLTEKGIRSKRYYVADLKEFGVNTYIILNFEVIGRIHLLVKDGENQHDLFGTHTIRTYVSPGEEIFQKVISESLKQIISGLKPVSAGGMDKPFADKSASAAFKPTADRKVAQLRSFEGFTIADPASAGWVIIEKNRKGIALVKQAGHDRNYSIVAFAKIRSTPQSFDSISSFKKFIEKVEKIGESDKEFKDYQDDITVIQFNGQDCIRSDFFTEDHGASGNRKAPYMLKGFTIHCMYPDSSNRAVAIGYSQRYEKGKAPLALDNEAQQFVESFRFEPLSTDILPKELTPSEFATSLAQVLSKSLPMKMSNGITMTKVISDGDRMNYYFKYLQSKDEFNDMRKKSGLSETDARERGIAMERAKMCSSPFPREIIQRGITVGFYHYFSDGEFYMHIVVDKCK